MKGHKAHRARRHWTPFAPSPSLHRPPSHFSQPSLPCSSIGMQAFLSSTSSSDYSSSPASSPRKDQSYLDQEMARHHRMRHAHDIPSDSRVGLGGTSLSVAAADGDELRYTPPPHAPAAASSSHIGSRFSSSPALYINSSKIAANIPVQRRADGMRTLYLAARAMGDYQRYGLGSPQSSDSGSSDSEASPGGRATPSPSAFSSVSLPPLTESVAYSDAGTEDTIAVIDVEGDEDEGQTDAVGVEGEDEEEKKPEDDNEPPNPFGSSPLTSISSKSTHSRANITCISSSSQAASQSFSSWHTTSESASSSSPSSAYSPSTKRKATVRSQKAKAAVKKKNIAPRRPRPKKRPAAKPKSDVDEESSRESADDSSASRGSRTLGSDNASTSTGATGSDSSGSSSDSDEAQVQGDSSFEIESSSPSASAASSDTNYSTGNRAKAKTNTQPTRTSTRTRGGSRTLLDHGLDLDLPPGRRMATRSLTTKQVKQVHKPKQGQKKGRTQGPAQPTKQEPTETRSRKRTAREMESESESESGSEETDSQGDATSSESEKRGGAGRGGGGGGGPTNKHKRLRRSPSVSSERSSHSSDESSVSVAPKNRSSRRAPATATTGTRGTRDSTMNKSIDAREAARRR